MKKIILMLFITILVLVCACANGVREKSTNSGSDVSKKGDVMLNISDLTGREWKLIKVYINGSDTQFTRSSLPSELGDCFTIKFDGQTVSGIGAPNRYSAPYTIGDNQTISIMIMRSTLMASLFEPENLKEYDYNNYVQNSHSWSIVDGQMELHSKTADNREVRLVFSL